MWDSLKIGGYTWHPFQGEITVEPESIRVAVENSRLCGISSPGFLRVKQGGIEVAFRLKAEKSDLNRCMTCLTQRRVIAEGTFDLDGKIEGKATGTISLKGWRGRLHFRLPTGMSDRIRHWQG